MYGETHICKFCSQLFQPKVKNIILPDPVSIFEKEEPPILKNKYNNKEINEDEEEEEEEKYDIYDHFDEFYNNLRRSKYEYNSFLKHFINKKLNNIEDLDVEIPKQFIPSPPPRSSSIKPKSSKTSRRRRKIKNDNDNNNENELFSPIKTHIEDEIINDNENNNVYHPISPKSSFRYSMRRSSYKPINKPLYELKRPKTSREIHKKCLIKSSPPYIEEPDVIYLKNTEYYRNLNFNRSKSPYNVKMKCLKVKC